MERRLNAYEVTVITVPPDDETKEGTAIAGGFKNFVFTTIVDVPLEFAYTNLTSTILPTNFASAALPPIKAEILHDSGQPGAARAKALTSGPSPVTINAEMEETLSAWGLKKFRNEKDTSEAESVPATTTAKGSWTGFKRVPELPNKLGTLSG